jgi:hypothetical protein
LLDEEHYAQDATELYAVALMQQVAENLGVATTHNSAQKLADFVAYATLHGHDLDWFDTGPYPEYKAACERHLPRFVARLAETFPGETFDFVSVEAEYRNQGLKGDFLIFMQPADTVTSVSLKNYRKGIVRPQFNAQTYNSFVLGFLFDGKLGTYVDPTTNESFRGADFDARDAALVRNGYEPIVPAMHELDSLNRDIKAQFVYGARFEVLDREGVAVLKAERGRVGNAGADLVMGILGQIDPRRVKTRLLKMIGFDGVEEIMLMDPRRYSDTITNPRFRELRDIVQKGEVEWRRNGQSIVFTFAADGKHVLPVDVPFTINTNGAWVNLKAPATGVMKDGMLMLPGARRRKAKELATSINTYVNFGKTGIFDSSR